MSQDLEILLVEDNPNDAELTLHALKKARLANQVVHVKDGEEALDFLFCRNDFSSRIMENKPRLILLDLKLPKVDGLEVLEAIKRNEVLREVPIVVLTSSREEPDIARCYDLGANSYIVKPVEFPSFTKAVEQLGFYWLLLNQPPLH